MKYNELVSISGLSGLFQLISTKSDGAIVRNIEENITKFVPARLHNVTPLDSIEVFTEENNVQLFEVFKSFKQNEGSAGEIDITKADNKKVKEHFGKLFPAFDKERVYVSDMKKMIKWYAILKKLDLLHEEVAETIANEVVAPEEVVEVAEPKKEKKPRKKAEPKNTEA
jgi:Ca2+-binding EF-hand superfamily protein